MVVTFKLIKIGKPDCAPCVELEKNFSLIEDEFPGIEIQKEDLSNEIKEKYNIEKIPLLILYKGDIEITRLQTSDIKKVHDWLSLRFL